MKNLMLLVVLGLVGTHAQVAGALNLLANGNLDRSYAQEIVPGFFLPKPLNWVNQGTRTITGPYEDEMSSEPWAGPAPTPVTTDGLLDPPPPNGVGGPDGAVFFKPFSGGGSNGPATGLLYQDVLGTPGTQYTLTGWAGAEANALMSDAQFAIEFRDAGNALLGDAVLSLMPGLFVANGEPFNYKQYSVSGVAPIGTATVRARVSMIGGLVNPAGGGQAFVVDDFELTGPGNGSNGGAVPEPATAGLALLSLLGLGLKLGCRRGRA